MRKENLGKNENLTKNAKSRENPEPLKQIIEN